MENNKNLLEIAKVLGNVKGWLIALIGAVTIVVVVIQAFNYQSGDPGEKAEAIKRIRNTIFFGVGVSIFAWFSEYVVNIFSSI